MPINGYALTVDELELDLEVDEEDTDMVRYREGERRSAIHQERQRWRLG